jgi:hypothetical protein
MSKGFEWVVSPKVIADGLEEYGRKALVAIQAVANYWGQSIQDEARENAVWEDRTGNARGGLFFAVDGFGLSPLVGEVTPEAKSEMSDVERRCQHPDHHAGPHGFLWKISGIKKWRTVRHCHDHDRE